MSAEAELHADELDDWGGSDEDREGAGLAGAAPAPRDPFDDLMAGDEGGAKLARFAAQYSIPPDDPLWIAASIVLGADDALERHGRELDELLARRAEQIKSLGPALGEAIRTDMSAALDDAVRETRRAAAAVVRVTRDATAGIDQTLEAAAEAKAGEIVGVWSERTAAEVNLRIRAETRKTGAVSLAAAWAVALALVTGGAVLGVTGAWLAHRVTPEAIARCETAANGVTYCALDPRSAKLPGPPRY